MIGFRVLNAAAVLVIVAASVSCRPCPPCEQASIPSPTPPTFPEPLPSEPPTKHSQPGHEAIGWVKPTPTPATAAIVGIQSARWNQATLKASWQISLDKAVMLYVRTKDRYEAVAKFRSDGTPAPVIFALHYRESSNSFACHLHEGSSLLHRTRYVPRGRLLAPKEPPYQWETSAEDALYACDQQLCDQMNGPWTDLNWSLDRIEHYNGWGYRRLGVPSPYLWSGTNVYTAGKYIADGHYNKVAIDQQLGCAAILKRMQQKGIDIKFAK